MMAPYLALESLFIYSHKFLWFPWDGAWQLLQSTLAEWLGSELIID